MNTYDNFSKTFAKSRKNMKWSEIEYFTDFLKQKTNPDLSSGVKRNEIEGSILNENILYKNKKNKKLINFSTSSKGQKNKKLKILDIGCGSGRLLNFLLQAGINIDYLGIDSSSGMIKEAKNEFSGYDFQILDMTDLDKIKDKYDIIFFIASFHHLSLESSRINVLNKAKNLLNEGGIIFQTNWNLLGEKNFKKYEKSYKGNGDFGIKIGEFSRYYHSFDIKELNELFTKTGFEIIENKIFELENNIISIIIKK